MKKEDEKRELALIRKAKRGDVKAFSALYAQIYTELYKFALYTLRHPQDAEDAVSETVMAAYENITKLKSETAFRSWIFTILANQCRKKFRGREKGDELTEELAQPEADSGLSTRSQEYSKSCAVSGEPSDHSRPSRSVKV